MISYILRLIGDFKREHGYRPNLLYLNELHSRHLKSEFSGDFSLQQMCSMFELELIIDQGIVHPHVAWIQAADTLAI
ncbi:MAG: hypothetical protein P8Z75_07065 [Gammaproteobacteria bacterium]|jgi:hypothetical protein